MSYSVIHFSNFINIKIILVNILNNIKIVIFICNPKLLNILNIMVCVYNPSRKTSKCNMTLDECHNLTTPFMNIIFMIHFRCGNERFIYFLDILCELVR